MRHEDALPLTAEISVSQLREEETLGRALAQHHRVRLRRYSEVVGVVVDVGEWERLTSLITGLQRDVEELEERNLRALVARRAQTASFEPGAPGRAAAIFDESATEIRAT